MQTSAVKKQAAAVSTAPAAKTVAPSARRIMARARYQAPTVASYPISGCEQSGPLSMIGNG